jgi:uracil-DNA glycosylase
MRNSAGPDDAPDAAPTLLAAPEEFVARLAAARIGETFNFYREGAGADARCTRLVDYLRRRGDSRLLLVGEAAGYRGARISGLPFTSERQLTGCGPAEATATIVQGVLADLELEALCWNAVPTHPGTPTSNRRPTRAEVAASQPFLEELAEGRRVVAVGRLAASVTGAPYVRHPSHGGAAAFRAGLLALDPTPGGGGSPATIPARRTPLVRRFHDEDLQRETG